MERHGLIESMERLYATATTELDCDQVQSLLPAYVEAEIAGAVSPERFAPFQAHLKQCPDCAHEHLALRQVTELEFRGALPSPAEILSEFETAAQPEPDQAAR